MMFCANDKESSNMNSYNIINIYPFVEEENNVIFDDIQEEYQTDIMTLISMC